MYRTTLYFVSIACAFFATGCVTLEPAGRISASSALEVPPDLTAADTTRAIRVPSAKGAPVSARTQRAFDEFQSVQQQADYQAFLEWRKNHGGDKAVSLAAFRQAKLEVQHAQLQRDGVLVASDQEGRQILLISDNLEESWNRVDTALINLNVQLLNTQPSNRVFRISYDVGRDGGTDQGWRNWATQLTGRAIYNLKLTEEKSVVVAAIFDRNGRPVASPSANTFIQRLAVQLKTFAGKQEQFVTGGSESLAGLSLRKRNDGQLQLVIPEKPNKAWNRVASAMRDAAFSVADRDRESLALWIRYAGPGGKTRKSLLTRLGIRKEKEKIVIEKYRVQLARDGEYDATTVAVWDSENLPAAANDQILAVIFEKLKN